MSYVGDLVFCFIFRMNLCSDGLVTKLIVMFCATALVCLSLQPIVWRCSFQKELRASQTAPLLE